MNLNEIKQKTNEFTAKVRGRIFSVESETVRVVEGGRHYSNLRDLDKSLINEGAAVLRESQSKKMYIDQEPGHVRVEYGFMIYEPIPKEEADKFDYDTRSTPIAQLDNLFYASQLELGDARDINVMITFLNGIIRFISPGFKYSVSEFPGGSSSMYITKDKFELVKGNIPRYTFQLQVGDILDSVLDNVLSNYSPGESK